MSPAVPTLAQIRATIRAGMWIDVTAHRAPDPMHLTQRRLVSRVTARDISLVADGGGETIPWPASSCIEMDPDGTLRFCDRDDGGVRMTLRPARTATPPDDPDLQFALVYLAEAPRHESRPDSTFTRHAAQLAVAGLAERYLHGGASPAWTLTPAGRDAVAAIDPARRAGFEESRIRNLIRDSVQGATGAAPDQATTARIYAALAAAHPGLATMPAGQVAVLAVLAHPEQTGPPGIHG